MASRQSLARHCWRPCLDRRVPEIWANAGWYSHRWAARIHPRNLSKEDRVDQPIGCWILIGYLQHHITREVPDEVHAVEETGDATRVQDTSVGVQHLNGLRSPAAIAIPIQKIKSHLVGLAVRKTQ